MRSLKRSLYFFLAMEITCSSVHAASISEISLSPRTVFNTQNNQVTIPGHIELSDLENFGPVELVLIDAANSLTRYGKIKQVISVPASITNKGPDIRLIAGGPWPTQTLPVTETTPSVGSLITVQSTSFTLNWFANNQLQPTSILLFDRATGLSLATGKIQTASLGTAKLLDVVTFRAAGQSAKSYTNETIWELSPDMAWAKVTPNSPVDPDKPAYVLGPPQTNNDLHFGSWLYSGFNPGFRNPSITQHNPEPSSGILLMLACTMTLQHRRPTR